MSDHRGSDAGEAMGRIGRDAVAAWSAPGKLDGIAHLPIGDIPAAMAVQFPAMDMVVHGWDLARATGAPVAWNQELVQDTYGFVTQTFAEPAMRGDSFAPPVESAADASVLDKTVAFLGRQP